MEQMAHLVWLAKEWCKTAFLMLLFSDTLLSLFPKPLSPHFFTNSRTDVGLKSEMSLHIVHPLSFSLSAAAPAVLNLGLTSHLSFLCPSLGDLEEVWWSCKGSPQNVPCRNYVTSTMSPNLTTKYPMKEVGEAAMFPPQYMPSYTYLTSIQLTQPND